MATTLEQYRIYLEQDKHECNLLLNRINTLLTSQTLFVATVSFLYSSLQKELVTQKVAVTAVTAVSAIALLTVMLALMAILLGSRILRHWHRQGEKLIDSDANGDLVGCHLAPRRHLPDKTHTWSIDVFGVSLPAVFVVFWVLAICWVQGWLG